MPTTPFHFPPNKECYGLDRKFKYNRGIKSEFDKKKWPSLPQLITQNIIFDPYPDLERVGATNKLEDRRVMWSDWEFD